MQPETPQQMARRLAIKANHYSGAFDHAAKIIRSRGETPEAEILAGLMDKKAELERTFRDRLTDDPIGTLTQEGLI